MWIRKNTQDSHRFNSFRIPSDRSLKNVEKWLFWYLNVKQTNIGSLNLHYNYPLSMRIRKNPQNSHRFNSFPIRSDRSLKNVEKWSFWYLNVKPNVNKKKYSNIIWPSMKSHCTVAIAVKGPLFRLPDIHLTLSTRSNTLEYIVLQKLS